jgi:hypothetical protein
MCENRLFHPSLTVAVAFLFILTGCAAGFLVASANGLDDAAASVGASTAPSFPVTSGPEFDGLNANALGAAAIAHDPSMATYLAQVPTSVYQGLIEKVLAVQDAQGKARTAAINSLSSQVTTDSSCTNCAVTVGSLALAVAIAACVAGGAESLGTVCLAAFVGAAIATALAYIFGTSAANAVSEAVEASGHQMIKDLAILGFSNIVNGTSTNINALNSTQNALGYQAAAAALAQLPNVTYSPAADLALGVGGSSIAAQLASEYWANGQDLASALGFTMNNFDTIQGSTNPSGYYCPLNVYASIAGSGSTADILSPYETSHGSGTCPTPSVAFTYPYGNLFSTADFSLGTYANGLGSSGGCAAVWVNPQAGVAIVTQSSGGGSLSTEWIPVNGSTPWYNLTATSAMNSAATAAYINSPLALNVSITSNTVTGAPTFPIGGYYVCVSSTSTDAVLHASIAFPLNSVDLGIFDQQATDINYISNGASSGAGGDSYPAGTLLYNLGSPSITSSGKSIGVLKDSIYGTITSFYACEWSGGGGSAGCSQNFQAETYLGQYLWNLAFNAAKVGQVYWTFLRGLGYTSAAQVAADAPQCLIPSPSQVLPSVISTAALAKMSAANLTVLYLATLAKLGYTFNASSALTVFNICGHHVVVPPAPWPLATKAYGWVYVPNATKDSSDTTTQKFSVPDTWNYSGLIYIQPALSGMTVQLNTTWLLPDTINPSTLFVQPITNSQTGTTRSTPVNPNAPTSCLTSVKNCNQTGYIQVVGPLIGNSSRANGSAYPAAQDGNPYGYAVFLTACWYQTAGNSANPTYGLPHSGSCHFGLNSLQGNGSGGSCLTTINPSCGSNESCGIFGCGGSNLCGPQGIFLFSSITNGLYQIWGSLAGFGCPLAEVLTIAIFLVLIVFVVLIVAAAVRAGRNRGST